MKEAGVSEFQSARLSGLLFLSLIVGLAPVVRAGDFDNWHIRQSPASNVVLNAVAYGKGQFVAVGQGGTILTSPDGSNWTSRVSGTTQYLRAVAASPQSFVVVGDPGTTLSSSDGIDWTVQIVPQVLSGGPTPLSSVAYGNGVFVAVGSLIYSSPDGKTWSVGKFPQGLPSPVLSVSYGNGLFVAVGMDAFLYTSPDGTNWSTQFVPNLGGVRSVTFGAEQFVAVGGLTDPRHATIFTWVTTNALVWPAPQTIGNTLTYLSRVTYGGGLYFALGATDTWGLHQVFVSSSDGLHWTNGEFPSGMGINSAAFGAGTYVLVGNTILQSDILVPTPGPAEPRLGIIPGAPLKISIQGSAGEHLRLEYLDDFAAGTNNWQALDTISLDGASAFWSDTNPPTARRFYRAITLP